jgi:hypothetical protein
MSHPCLIRLRAVLGSSTACFALADSLASRDAHTVAFPYFAKAARAGLRQAQYRLGRSYLLGLGVPPSIGEALRWLRRAADSEDTAAQTQLAALALQGISDTGNAGLFHDGGREPESDYQAAEHWCRKAVAAGSVEAKALLGFILTAGPAHLRDADMGEALYRDAAREGWSRGQLGLAMALLREGATERAAESLALLRSAANGGVAIAHHLMGMLAESGAAGPVDFTAAGASYEAAAELGHAQAQVRYGFALLLGRGVERNVFSAETWLRRAAMAGDPQAAAVIGFLYARDGDLPPNYAEAALWLRQAATAGHIGAARVLGRMLLLGTGLPKDDTEAAHWLRIAADHGDEAARADLVRLALTRRVGHDDQVEATRLLRRDAAAGDRAAQFDLGLCLAQGIGSEQDGLAAFAWVSRAAEAGDPRAAEMLAQMEANGC